jgi:1,4-dihydroxy-2-naphthoate octaprenyltransferase|tara:strand:+ start:620 stop:976 length:357 start_codon:yes stop_codon:yes gene_type:complete
VIKLLCGRKINTFEKILLIVGLAVTLGGFYLIDRTYASLPGLSWIMILAIFGWLILIILFVISSNSVDVKEELSIIIKEQVDEIKLLKKIVKEQLEEVKLLRADITARSKSKVRRKKK